MSDTLQTFRLPPLLVYPERRERSLGWIDQVETALTSMPLALRARFGNLWARRLINGANSFEAGFGELTTAEIRHRAEALRGRLRREGFRLAVVTEAFALIRETARQTLGMRHFDVQLAGGYAILNGSVAEMDTGEGKTLTATLAAATAALAGIPVHVVTVNDYLAQRDSRLMLPLYEALGLKVGTIVHGQSQPERRRAYGCDITYASNKEIAFDYLRDRIAIGERPRNIALKLRGIAGSRLTGDTVMRGLHFAIVDEADSVLVDEARTPLIISRESPPEHEERWARTAFALIETLEDEQDYRVVQAERRIELTRAGREKLAQAGETLGGVWRSAVRREEAARQALMALRLFERGDHYLVHDGKVEIVDEYTGRIMADRSWSQGLHQLIEVKENCEVTGRKVPLARITYQRFFRRYQRLAGMTGTAREVSRELWSVYRLTVTRIRPNLPARRRRLRTRVFDNADEKWLAVARRVSELQVERKATLIGTRSVAASEQLSDYLTAAGIEHEVLNAAQDEREAEIIALAGRAGRVTVATNMAGRGVDIPVEPSVLAAGGLHVILSERHDARRIDRQLEGRCGRQGEPGVTEAFLSLEDPLLRLAPEALLRGLTALPGRQRRFVALSLFRWCQARAERAHSSTRRALVKHDLQLGVMLAFSGGIE